MLNVTVSVKIGVDFGALSAKAFVSVTTASSSSFKASANSFNVFKLSGAESTKFAN